MFKIDNSIIEHHLCVDPTAKKVKQKHQSFNAEKYVAITEEVDHFFVARFIRKAHYPGWLSNMVLVKKVSGKWTMCVSFMDLNKACLKDSFPLPCIDLIGDYGYNQI